MQLAYLARRQSPATVKSLTFFGTKRRINTFNLQKLFQVDMRWNGFLRLLVKKYGYQPAKKYKIGFDSESKLSYRETHHWLTPKEWRDGFDYRGVLQSTELPPLLLLIGVNDRVLGYPDDVARETGDERVKVLVVGKAEGFRHDDDYINLLPHPYAPRDHFQAVLE